ncbi:hypothetical protein CapIbe_008608 [Capra ibex]
MALVISVYRCRKVPTGRLVGGGNQLTGGVAGLPVWAPSADVRLAQTHHLAKPSVKSVASRLHLAGQEATANSQREGV